VTLTRDVSPGVHRIEDAFVNWYLVDSDDGVLVVDAGLPASWASLSHALDAIGRPYSDLGALILTHAHFDHVGFARRAQLELQLAVHCHPDDFEVAAHPLRYKTERPRALYVWRPRPAMIIGRMVAAGALWTKGVRGLQPLVPGEVLDVPGRPRVLATPGHTFGHVSFHFPDRDTVIAGDALVTLDPYTGMQGPRLVARAATADSALARASLDAIAETQAKTVLPGHGGPWTDGARLAVEHARAAGSA
jgi:glyoxylase-like metal-dependent hydrolase (beta-lactamase superfamily II)